MNSPPPAQSQMWQQQCGNSMRSPPPYTPHQIQQPQQQIPIEDSIKPEPGQHQLQHQNQNQQQNYQQQPDLHQSTDPPHLPVQPEYPITQPTNPTQLDVQPPSPLQQYGQQTPDSHPETSTPDLQPRSTLYDTEAYFAERRKAAEQARRDLAMMQQSLKTSHENPLKFNRPRFERRVPRPSTSSSDQDHVFKVPLLPAPVPQASTSMSTGETNGFVEGSFKQQLSSILESPPFEFSKNQLYHGCAPARGWW